MISVLIPIFNTSVFELVSEIHTQLLQQKVDFEIICIDDASTVFYNENTTITALKNVYFYQENKNLGRSKIRNVLAQKAAYNWLLFLDSDVFPKAKNFIKSYLDILMQNTKIKVYCGGIVYKKEQPLKTKKLRWVYGIKREEITVAKRVENPYAYFFGANFLIHKSVFNTCKFDETLVKYGFEDVLFVNLLAQHKVPLLQVNNNVYHLGIEDNAIFIEKTQQAIENLVQLYCKKAFTGTCIVKILSVYEKITYVKMVWFFSVMYKVLNRLMVFNLSSGYPSLAIFDLYKLSYFCFLIQKKTTSRT